LPVQYFLECTSFLFRLGLNFDASQNTHVSNAIFYSMWWTYISQLCF
jgi:hypothetical protein